MKVHGYLCDCGCGQKGTSQAKDSHPDGWLIVYPGGLHFASWGCLSRYAGNVIDHPVRVR